MPEVKQDIDDRNVLVFSNLLLVPSHESSQKEQERRYPIRTLTELRHVIVQHVQKRLSERTEKTQTIYLFTLQLGRHKPDKIHKTASLCFWSELADREHKVKIELNSYRKG